MLLVGWPHPGSANPRNRRSQSRLANAQRHISTAPALLFGAPACAPAHPYDRARSLVDSSQRGMSPPGVLATGLAAGSVMPSG
jgi:hypothetical protein